MKHCTVCCTQLGHVAITVTITVSAININRHDTVCAQLHFNICKEMGVKLDSRHRYDLILEQVMNVRLPYYGTNKCEATQLFLTINRTS